MSHFNYFCSQAAKAAANSGRPKRPQLPGRGLNNVCCCDPSRAHALPATTQERMGEILIGREDGGSALQDFKSEVRIPLPERNA